MNIFMKYFQGKWKLFGTTLENEAGITLPGSWQLPATGKINSIKNNDTNMYLAVNAVTVVEENFNANNVRQQWKRSADDGSGYFTLTNPKTGKFLTAKNWFPPQVPHFFTVEGIYM